MAQNRGYAHNRVKSKYRIVEEKSGSKRQQPLNFVSQPIALQSAPSLGSPPLQCFLPPGKDCWSGDRGARQRGHGTGQDFQMAMYSERLQSH